MANLQQPSESFRLLRKLDEQFVKNLKLKMLEDPTGPGVPPVAVLCCSVSEKEMFSERLKDVYKYEVLGGQHTTTARSELAQEGAPRQPAFQQRAC